MERKLDISKIIFPFFLFICITTSVIPIILSIDLIRLDSYDSFIALLDKFYISMSYFCRVIIANLDYENFYIFKMIKTLITSLSYMNIIMILLSSYLWAASHETYMKKRNISWRMIITIYINCYLLIAFIIIFGFSLTSLNAIIYLFFCSGIIMFIAHMAMIIISVIFLVKEVKGWHLLYKKCNGLKVIRK